MSVEKIASKDLSPDVEDDEIDVQYKAPEHKALNELIEADAEDQSLNKYKDSLLPGAKDGMAFPDDPRHVIVKRLVLMAEGRPEKELELKDQSLAEIKKQKFTIKEGSRFKIRIEFFVQTDIVTGLKYVQKSYKLGGTVLVDKMSHMCGSYGPKKEIQTSTSVWETAPAGLLSRGSYQITSLFTDDYKTEHLKWDWTLEIRKEWDD